ncbi:Uncharacterised protein [Klebsiella pneumoniae]|uniref:hypothetical protein n=1 Tax=Klebsiella pneumoniae TaxID=573 RepID=UPI0007CD3314|nr:hypothetical protein [Klebsiella pneumoniae]SAU96322.1 Uncharacterised protein [Klebsiella pneumoniae]
MYPVFENGSCWVKVDFHLHTRADKEFRYAGEPDEYIRDYVSALKAADVGVGVITNHNMPCRVTVFLEALRASLGGLPS